MKTKEEQKLTETIKGFGYHLPTLVVVLFKLAFRYLWMLAQLKWNRMIYK